MASEKVETIVAGNYAEMEREEADPSSAKSRLSKLFWHGGSVYDAWFSCASNQALINYNNLNYIYISRLEHFHKNCSLADAPSIIFPRILEIL